MSEMLTVCILHLWLFSPFVLKKIVSINSAVTYMYERQFKTATKVVLGLVVVHSGLATTWIPTHSNNSN